MRLGYLVAWLLLGTFAWASVDFVDIPPQHWARGSIARLVDMGIVTGYQDHTFRGRKSVTRYELALYLSNIEHVISKRVSQQLAKDPASEATARRVQGMEHDIRTLRAEVQSLREELDRLRTIR